MSMMPVRHLDIAVIGDEDLVSGLRLGGVSRSYVIKGDQDIQGSVRKALSELIDDPDAGIVVMQEDYAEYVGDMLTRVRESKMMTPVIIEVPSKLGTKYGDIKEYYKAFIRKAVGFGVEI